MPAVLFLGGVPIHGQKIGRFTLKHDEASQFARKQIVKSRPLLEYTGERDEVITLSGRLVPFASVSSILMLEVLQGLRASKSPTLIVRASGENLGFYVVESLSSTHEKLHPTGIGREISFTAKLVKDSAPDMGFVVLGVQSIVNQFLSRWLG